METKLDPQTPLERNVARWANSHVGNGYDDLATVFRDLFYGGCQSGMVSHLIYYTDTVKFYRKYRKEIEAILKEYREEGVLDSPANLNGWDEDDPFARDTHNQNLLAWFGFEEAARRLCDRAGIEA